MNVVAVLEGPRQAWVWRIVDDGGNELSSSGTDYTSMADALKAGAAHRDRLMADRPPIVRQPIVRQPIRGRPARP